MTTSKRSVPAFPGAPASKRRVTIAPSNDNVQSNDGEIVRGLRLAARQLWLLADERQRTTGTMRERAPAGESEDGPASTPWLLLRAVESELHLLRARDRDMRMRLFRDPAWDLLLHVYAGELRGLPLCLTDLARAADLPITSTARHLEMLVEAGLVVRGEPRGRKRARPLDLTADGRELLENHVLRSLDRMPEVRRATPSQ